MLILPEPPESGYLFGVDQFELAIEVFEIGPADVFAPLVGLYDPGAVLTVGVSLAALVVSIILGLLGAGAKLSGRPVLVAIATLYTTIIRGIPELVLMLLVFYGGSIGINNAKAVFEAIWSSIKKKPSEFVRTRTPPLVSGDEALRALRTALRVVEAMPSLDAFQ